MFRGALVQCIERVFSKGEFIRCVDIQGCVGILIIIIIPLIIIVVVPTVNMEDEELARAPVPVMPAIVCEKNCKAFS